MHISDDLRVSKATNDVYDDTLQVVRVNEQLFRWDVVPTPKQVDFLAYLSRATVIHPLELAHRALQAAQFLQIVNCKAIWLPLVNIL